MLQELCKKLKEKRKELGYSLEYTVEKTKLHPSAIKDIEDANLSNINPTYLKGFLRIYSSFLGIPMGSALQEIPSLSQQPKKQKKIKKDSSGGFSGVLKAIKSIPPEVIKKIIIVLVGIIVLWGAVNALRFVGAKIAAVFKQSRQERGEKQSSASASALSFEKAKELAVSLTARNKCFIKVLVDSKVLFEGILDKGIRETWKGKKEIELKISDGSAVYLEVNGKSIPTLTSMHKPIKSLKITHSGISVDK